MLLDAVELAEFCPGSHASLWAWEADCTRVRSDSGRERGCMAVTFPCADGAGDREGRTRDAQGLRVDTGHPPPAQAQTAGFPLETMQQMCRDHLLCSGHPSCTAGMALGSRVGTRLSPSKPGPGAQSHRGAPDVTELFLDCTEIWWWVVYIKSVLLKSTYKLYIYIYFIQVKIRAQLPLNFRVLALHGPTW